MCLDSLAFACTYGKKNCLTDEMYRGELSLGKVPPPTNWYTLLTLFSVAYLARPTRCTEASSAWARCPPTY